MIRLRGWHCISVWFVVFSFLAFGAVCINAQPTPDVVWSVQTHSYFVSPVAISPDGALVASPGTNNSVRLGSLAEGSFVRSLVGHRDGVASLAFSPDGSLLASTADDRTLRLWSVLDGALLRTISLGSGNRQLSAVAFHPDGQHVAADHDRSNLVLWNVADGTPVWETLGNAAEIESIAFSPDGSLVAVAGGYRGLDTTIRVIGTYDGQLLHSLITSNSYGVRQLAFSPDGKWLAAGCDRLTNFSGQVELWRVADWQRLLTLPVHAPALAFSPDGKVLVTLSQTRMDFWWMPSGTRAASLGVPSFGTYSPHLSIAIALRGNRIVTGNYRLVATPNGTLTVSTTAAIRFPVLMNLVTQNGGLGTFGWTGGCASYQLQRRWFGSPEWENVGSAVTNCDLTVPLDGTGAIFRVVGDKQ